MKSGLLIGFLALALSGLAQGTFLNLNFESGLAGQTGQLLFTGGGLFDDIQFSNQPIPEPSALGLVSIGSVLLGWHFWRKR